MSHLQQLPRVALAQMEVLPGRPEANARRIRGLISQAREGGAEIVAFPEMCLSGYIVGDLWEVDAVVEDWAAFSEEVRAAGDGVTVLFGNVVRDPGALGEDGRPRKYNTARVCHDGRWVERPGLPPGLPAGCQPKTLHPNYRFFDDDRHFYSVRKLAAEQGRPLSDWTVPFEVPRRGGGRFRFGAQLCEDIWCADYRWDDAVLDTLSRYAAAGAEAVFNLSSSPWTWQKNDKRNRTVRDILRQSPLPFLYVNHVGAQNNGKNILVFDGDTTAYEPDGAIAARARPWREELVFAGGGEPPRVEAAADALPAVSVQAPAGASREVKAGSSTTVPVPPAASPEVEADSSPTVSEPLSAPAPREVEAVYGAVLTGLRHLDHIRGGANRWLVGLSGGIDSSVVACLLERAFGSERVFAVNMPTRFNAAVTRGNAKGLAERLGLDYLSVPIEELYGAVSKVVREAVFPRSPGDYSQLVDENLQARIRGSDVLSGLAARHGLLFTNNGNKTEMALGYTTLYGDLAGAAAPIADLYKVQVYEVGEYLNAEVYGREVIPRNLLDRSTVPSAELSAEQDVTRGKGDPIKYGYHDAVLRQLIEYRRHPADLMQWLLEGRLFAELGWCGSDRDRTFADYFPTPRDWLDDLEWVEEQLRISYFKRIQSPPLIVLSKRAFGFDLRETQVPPYRPRRWRELAERVRGLERWPPERG